MMHFFKFATLVALLLRTTSAQTSSVTNRIEIVKDLQFQLIGDAAQGAKAQKVASDGRITGPATIVLDGLAGGSAYKVKIWDKSRDPHVYVHEVRSALTRCDACK